MSDTKQRLLQAAREKFAEQGYPGTSIREIAAAVGIKESSVYNHFPSKRALLDAILDRAEQRFAQVAERFGIAQQADAAAVFDAIEVDKLERMAGQFLDLWLRDPEIVAVRRILTLEQYRTPSAGSRLRELLVTDPLSFQTELFRGLIERGRFLPAPPEAVALAFWGPVVAILMAADAPGGARSAKRHLRAHLEHFRATHAAPAEIVR